MFSSTSPSASASAICEAASDEQLVVCCTCVEADAARRHECASSERPVFTLPRAGASESCDAIGRDLSNPGVHPETQRSLLRVLLLTSQRRECSSCCSHRFPKVLPIDCCRANHLEMSAAEQRSQNVPAKPRSCGPTPPASVVTISWGPA